MNLSSGTLSTKSSSREDVAASIPVEIRDCVPEVVVRADREGANREVVDILGGVRRDRAAASNRDDRSVEPGEAVEHLVDVVRPLSERQLEAWPPPDMAGRELERRAGRGIEVAGPAVSGELWPRIPVEAGARRIALRVVAEACVVDR